MHPDFWHERWTTGRIGFHRDAVHPALPTWWPQLGVGRGGRVLVPLCGKSLDVGWLADQGHEVTGVELSPIAAEALVTARGGTAAPEPAGPFQVWRAPGIEVLQGDVFALDAPPFDAAYDRAALVALPPELREAYARVLTDHLVPGAPLLLVVFEYPQDERSGPPFSIPVSGVERLYGAHFDLDVLASTDLGETDPSELDHLGVSRMHHHLLRLVRRSR